MNWKFPFYPRNDCLWWLTFISRNKLYRYRYLLFAALICNWYSSKVCLQMIRCSLLCYTHFCCGQIISMAYCKTTVTPLLTHWSYCSLTLSHRYVSVASSNAFKLIFFRVASLTLGNYCMIIPLPVRWPWTYRPVPDRNEIQPSLNGVDISCYYISARQLGSHIYRKISNIRRTKSYTSNVSRLGLQLPVPNILKPSGKWRMKM